ncbi:MAG TPA: hypothetical protein VFR59_11130, partial [Steroidobacteraceae bacterium]|nr:hypothetical protein [Steroidobacteraceae bacterium]
MARWITRLCQPPSGGAGARQQENGSNDRGGWDATACCGRGRLTRGGSRRRRLIRLDGRRRGLFRSNGGVAVGVFGVVELLSFDDGELEDIATSRNCADDVLRRIAEGPPHLDQRLRQHAVGDDDLAPDRVHQVLAGNELPVPLD